MASEDYFDLENRVRAHNDEKPFSFFAADVVDVRAMLEAIDRLRANESELRGLVMAALEWYDALESANDPSIRYPPIGEEGDPKYEEACAEYARKSGGASLRFYEAYIALEVACRAAKGIDAQ